MNNKKEDGMFESMTSAVKSAGKTVVEAGRWTAEKLDKGIDKIAEDRFISREFEKQSKEYEIIYKEPKKFLQPSKLRAIDDKLRHILLTDCDIGYIYRYFGVKDSKGNIYRLDKVLEQKYLFSKPYGDRDSTKELFQIEYYMSE